MLSLNQYFFIASLEGILTPSTMSSGDIRKELRPKRKSLPGSKSQVHLPSSTALPLKSLDSQQFAIQSIGGLYL